MRDEAQENFASSSEGSFLGSQQTNCLDDRKSWPELTTGACSNPLD